MVERRSSKLALEFPDGRARQAEISEFVQKEPPRKLPGRMAVD
jgi:hypothetical protein